MDNSTARNTPRTSTWKQWADVSPDVKRRLYRYGIKSHGDWRRLSAAQRARLFGITPAIRAALNAVRP